MSERSKKILNLSSKRRALLEAALEEAGVGAPSMQRITRRDRTGPLPVSFAQQRLLVLDQLAPGSATYNTPINMRLNGRLNEAALRAAVDDIVRRHETLRVTFVATDGDPYQVIQPPEPIPLEPIDLSGLPPAERETEMLRRVEREAQHVFDLARGPIFRATLLRLSDEDHVLIMNMHHIVSDGWSLSVFMRDLFAFYTAHLEGKPSPLPELPVQYIDFAIWQREYLQGDVLERQLNYWKGQLSNLPVVELPVDHPRPAVQTFRGAHQSLIYPKWVRDGLSALSQQEGCTLFMTCLAAFATLLHRYSGQEDIVIGTPVANRDRAEVADLIGFFVNTLTLRVDLSGNPTFRELVQRVRAMTLQAYAHQDLPFEKLVEVLQPERDLSRAPLFQITFALVSQSPGGEELPGLEIRPVLVDNRSSKFDLTFFMEEFPDGLITAVEYSTDLFEAETIARFLNNYQALLEGIAANPDRRVGHLPILSAAEREQLFETWQPASVARPELCIHQAFEAQAARTPNAPALHFPALSSGAAEDRRLTYAELNQCANQLAHHLRGLGVGPETVVGIYMERSLEMIIGLLATFKAGAAYVPLIPSNPFDRTTYMLHDTRAKVLLTQDQLRDKLPEYDGPIVYADADWPAIAQCPASNPNPGTTLSNLAAIIYTSGSTGMPKGTALTGRGYMNMLRWYGEHMGVNAETRFLLQLAFSFDSALKDIMTPLLFGGELVLGPVQHNDPTTLLDIFEKHQVTALSSTPTMLYPLIDLAAARSYAPMSSLRCIDVGGEPTQLGKVQPWFSSPQCHSGFLHVYGPTECSDLSTGYGPLTGEAINRLEKLPIGPPLPNVRIYVLNEHGEVQPVGVPGEVYISGIGLARGYLHRPDLTAERFIPDPFTPPIPPSETGGDTGGGRMYRTGDVGRWRADGVLELMGRIDHQVKIRGIRVELGEIEAQLGQQPGVRECVVIVREDTPGDKRLAAYFLPQPGQSPRPADLAQRLKQSLPEHMVPSAFVMLEQWPLLSNGKVDRRALPAPDTTRRPDEAAIAPRDTVELQLVQIWESLLNVHPIGLADNFFTLGGHSLLAMRLVAQIQKQFRQKLPLAVLFQEATVEQLAARIRQGTRHTARSPLVGIQPRGEKRPFFCVHPVGGHVLCYIELAQQCGADQPFYGLQVAGLDSDVPLETRVQDMAAHYLAAIKNVQAEGPYRLGGWSFGGVVAFEMALQLQAHGQDVETLALIDSYAPLGADIPEAFTDEALVSDFARDLRGVFSLSIPDAELQARTPDEQLKYVLEQARQANILPPDAEFAYIHRLLEIFKTNVRALESYQPGTYLKPAVLFRAGEQLVEGLPDPAVGWRPLIAGGLSVHTMPGNHYTMIRKPHVQMLAKELQDCLDGVAYAVDR